MTLKQLAALERRKAADWARSHLAEAKKLGAKRAKKKYDQAHNNEFKKLQTRNRYRSDHGIPLEAPLLNRNREPAKAA